MATHPNAESPANLHPTRSGGTAHPEARQTSSPLGSPLPPVPGSGSPDRRPPIPLTVGNCLVINIPSIRCWHRTVLKHRIFLLKSTSGCSSAEITLAQTAIAASVAAVKGCMPALQRSEQSKKYGLRLNSQPIFYLRKYFRKSSHRKSSQKIYPKSHLDGSNSSNGGLAGKTISHMQHGLTSVLPGKSCIKQRNPAVSVSNRPFFLSKTQWHQIFYSGWQGLHGPRFQTPKSPES